LKIITVLENILSLLFPVISFRIKYNKKSKTKSILSKTITIYYHNKSILNSHLFYFCCQLIFSMCDMLLLHLLSNQWAMATIYIKKKILILMSTIPITICNQCNNFYFHCESQNPCVTERLFKMKILGNP